MRELDHDELVDRDGGDALDESFGALVEVLGGGRLDRRGPIRRPARR